MYEYIACTVEFTYIAQIWKCLLYCPQSSDHDVYVALSVLSTCIYILLFFLVLKYYLKTFVLLLLKPVETVRWYVCFPLLISNFFFFSFFEHNTSTHSSYNLSCQQSLMPALEITSCISVTYSQVKDHSFWFSGTSIIPPNPLHNYQPYTLASNCP